MGEWCWVDTSRRKGKVVGDNDAGGGVGLDN